MTEMRFCMEHLEELDSSRRAEWDAFIYAQKEGHLLQSWGWGELKAGACWFPVRLALRERPGGPIVAAAQVLCRTVFGVPARLGHVAYIPKGPVLDWHASADDGIRLARHFLGAVRRYMRQRGALTLQVEPNLEAQTPEAEQALLCFKQLGFVETQPVQPVRTIMLDVQKPEEVLLAQMKEKWRYNLRLAARKGVEVRPAQTLAELQAWYALLQTTAERDHFGIHTLDYYRRAWEIFAPEGQACLLLAYFQDELLAGIFVSMLAKEAVYLYGASSNERRHLMPNYLLQWEAIRLARATGVQRYDFWGIPATDEEHEAMAGVYRFKSGWGGRVVHFLGNYEYVYRPLTLNVLRRLWPRAQ